MTLVRDPSPPPEDMRGFEDHHIASMMLETRPGSRERAAFMEILRLRRAIKKLVAATRQST